MRKPTKVELSYLSGLALSCAALVLVGNLFLSERQKNADAVATNQALAAGAIYLTTEIAAQTAASTLEPPPYLTLTGTSGPTAADTLIVAASTYAPTLTLEPTLTPLPIATPGLRDCPVSAYESCPNQIGINFAGAAQAQFDRLTAHLTAAWEQLARYGNAAQRQDYAADMLFTSPQENSGGQVQLPLDRLPDFWEKRGGLGFNPENYRGHDGVQAVLTAGPKEFFQQGSDGLYRAIVGIQEQEDFEFALAAAARAKFAILYPNLDFTRPEALQAFDNLIRAEVRNAVTENGFRPKTAEPWPGAEAIFSFESGSFVDGVGEECIGSRPADGQRQQQVPERFVETNYVRGLEKLTPGNDEGFNRLDTRGSIMVSFVFDPDWRRLRADIFTLSSPPDPLQPGEPEPLDSESADERTRIDRWVPCGPGVVQPGETPPPTPRPTETPRPPTATVTQAPSSTVQPPPPTMTPAPTEAGTPTQPPSPTQPRTTPEATFTPLPKPSPTPWQPK